MSFYHQATLVKEENKYEGDPFAKVSSTNWNRVTEFVQTYSDIVRPGSGRYMHKLVASI